MITAVIVDDEHNAVEAMRLLLEKYHPEIMVVGMAYSVISAIDMIHSVKPDILFLDIELTDGSGFEIADKTKDCHYKLIFTTAYDEYALRAFRVNALDYLLKPIDVDELKKAIDRSKEYYFQRREPETLPSDNFDTKINVPEAEGYKRIDQTDIIYLSADSNYTRIYCKQGKNFILAKTLKDFESKLNTTLFLRVHHSYVVNINEVDKFIKGENCSLTMTNNQIIPVSRSRKKEVLDKLKLG